MKIYFRNRRLSERGGREYKGILNLLKNNSTFSEPFPYFYFGKIKRGNYVTILCNYVTLSVGWVVTFVDNPNFFTQLKHHL